MKQNNAFHSSSKFILNLIWRPCPKRQGQSIHKKKNTNRQPSSWADLVNRFRVRKAWHFFSCTSRCASSPVEGLGSEDAGKKVDLRSLKTTKRKEVWKAVGNVICCVSIRCVFLFVLCRNKKHQCIMTIKMCTKKWYSKNMITKKGSVKTVIVATFHLCLAGLGSSRRNALVATAVVEQCSTTHLWAKKTVLPWKLTNVPRKKKGTISKGNWIIFHLPTTHFFSRGHVSFQGR